MTLCVGCGKVEASRLECPACKKLSIPGSFFHDQDCFKKNWMKHKSIHTMVQAATKEDDFDRSALPPQMRNYNYKGSLRPYYPLSPKREVPAHIPRPDYADHPQGWSEIESIREKGPKINTPEEIERLRKVCRMTKEVLDATAALIRPGITTDELDAFAHQMIIDKGAYPSPLNYNGFPKSICTSVSECVCHGIPDQRPLQEGDIVNLDISVFYDGMHGDCNDTYPVGKCSAEVLDLINTTRRACQEAVAICKPGVPYREVGEAIGKVVGPKGYGIVRQYTGHSSSQRFHGYPSIVHYPSSRMAGRMEAGECFTIEPMINMGTASLYHWPDDWTALTSDGKPSAQHEIQILITETGHEILTRIPPSAKKNQKKKAKKAAAAAANGEGTPEGVQTPTEGMDKMEL